jgi:hypothetical protein
MPPPFALLDGVDFGDCVVYEDVERLDVHTHVLAQAVEHVLVDASRPRGRDDEGYRHSVVCFVLDHDSTHREALVIGACVRTRQEQ